MMGHDAILPAICARLNPHLDRFGLLLILGPALPHRCAGHQCCAAYYEGEALVLITLLQQRLQLYSPIYGSLAVVELCDPECLRRLLERLYWYRNLHWRLHQPWL